MQSHEAWLAEARSVLGEVGVDAVVMGAVAALQYRSSPRTTTDLDLLIGRAGDLRAAFEEHDFAVREVTDPSGDPFLFIITRNEVRIDIIVAETAYQEEALKRAINGYLSPEDVILHKLIAWRARDRDDIGSILEADIEIDSAYVDRWATEWDVADRWREAQGWKLVNGS